MVLRHNAYTCLGSSLLLFRRVPVKISEGIPDTSQIRPLDIYSMIMTIVSSAYHTILRPWVLSVTLEQQFAVKGGIQKAVGSLGFRAEYVPAGEGEIWAIALDFKKLYNSLAPRVAATRTL